MANKRKGLEVVRPEGTQEVIQRIKKKKSGRFKLLTFAAVILVIVYVPSLFKWVGGNTVNTELMRLGTIEDSISSDGVIIRNEEVLESPFDGKCIKEAEEGEKIPSSYRVATILNSSSEQILDDIKKVDLRITQALKEKAKNKEIFSEDIKKLDKNIEKYLTDIRTAANSNNFRSLRESQNEINSLIQKKSAILGNTGTADAFMNSLYNEKKNLQDQLKQNTRDIVSKTSGILSYMTDGNELLLNPSLITKLTVKDLEGIKTEKMQEKPNVVVKAGKTFAKVIKDFDYYMVFAVNSSDVSNFKVGSTIKVRINDILQVVDASIQYKSEDMDGKTILSLKADKYGYEISNMRKINADLILKSYDGLKVTVSSLKNVDKTNKTADIVIVNSNYASTIKVKLVGMNKEYAIIDSLDKQKKDDVAIYDTYITNPVNIKEGQLIDK